MSRTSQNGWPVVTKSQCDQGPFLGVKFPNGILHGPVAAIALWQLRRYAATVEPVHVGQCWGYDDKTIEGSHEISNHASGTAWDINAERHPMGTSPSHTLSAAQIAACHAIERASGGVLRWGGSYSGRPDAMHWEINLGQAATYRLAVKIAGPHADLSIGDVGANVGVLQHALNRVPYTGAAIATDGVFGPHTRDKVIAVQHHYRITADGIVGPVTRGKLGLE